MSGRHSSERRGNCATITPMPWLPALAGHQCRQVGAQVTAGNLAVGGLDLYLNPEMSDHLAGLLRSQVAALQLFHGTRLATGRPGRAFFLDLFDAPALPAGQVAFGHDASA